MLDLCFLYFLSFIWPSFLFHSLLMYILMSPTDFVSLEDYLSYCHLPVHFLIYSLVSSSHFISYSAILKAEGIFLTQSEIFLFFCKVFIDIILFCALHDGFSFFCGGGSFSFYLWMKNRLPKPIHSIGLCSPSLSPFLKPVSGWCEFTLLAQ